jgi:nicotinate-nucleotide adenylyltransferase
LTPADQRLEMLRLALEDREGTEICTLELDRGGVSYTLPTLRALREDPYRFDPLLIVGLDALSEIASWYSYEALLAEFDVVAVDRPGHDAETVRRALPACVAERWVDLGAPLPGTAPIAGALPGTGGRVLRLAAPPVPISSSDVRRRAANGLSLDGLVPPPVARYIQLRQLYRQEDLR